MVVAFRKALEDHVCNNGGDYRGNLTKDVTHLIAKEPTGNKYKYAREWNIKIIAVEWLFQSLERGMILDESLYSLLIPSAERGRNAWIRQVSPPTSNIGKRPLDGDAASTRFRKLRRTASAKLSSQNVGLWTDIVNGESKISEQKHDEWAEHPVPVRSSFGGGQLKSTLSEISNDALRISSDTALQQIKTEMPRVDCATIGMPAKQGIFSGRKLCVHGFNEKKV